MHWTGVVTFIASFLALTAIAFGVIRAKNAQEALGMSAIKKWKKGWAPLTVLIDEEDFLLEEVPLLREAVKSAARFWNEQTGVKLFAAPTEVGAGAVIPVLRYNPLTMEKHENSVAYAKLAINREGELFAAAVYMVDWENLPSLVLARAMKHEFGHCLGLAHDIIEYSVMYGKTSNRVYCVNPLDKEFLLEVYGG